MNYLKKFKIDPELAKRQGIDQRQLLAGQGATTPAEIANALEPLIPVPCGHALIRLGGEGDGGYLVPDDLAGIEACFSPGVNNFKDIEDHLARTYGIHSYLCDYSSDLEKFKTPLIEGMQFFEKKWLDVTPSPDNLDINTWVAKHSSSGSELLLQMDIESAEYRNLMHLSADLLQRFRIIVLELHGIKHLRDTVFLRGVFEPALRQIGRHFVSVHVHANNCCGSVTVNESLELPDIIEVTFLRRDRLRPTAEKLLLPHPLDRYNVPGKPPLHLSGLWLRHADIAASERIALRESVHWLERDNTALKEKVSQLEANIDSCGRYLIRSALEGFNPEQNISLGKQARQSNLSTFSTPEGAGGAINGKKTGKYGFHTPLENNPWWQVDLLQPHQVTGIVIYNRLDTCPERADTLRILISMDGEHWQMIYDHAGKPTFGGVTLYKGELPLALRLKGAQARFVRLAVTDRTYLHLDEVEIYGTILPS
jgi:hypothetical protein